MSAYTVVARTRWSDDPAIVGQCNRINDDGQRCVRSTVTHTDGSKHTHHWPAGHGGKTWRT